MMYPGVDEVLGSVIATLEEMITPAVEDETAASACRTAAQLLRSVRARLVFERSALAADNADLRSVLAAALDQVPDESRHALEAALAIPPGSTRSLPAELSAEATALRGGLVTTIDSIPDGSHPVRAAARAYLGRSLDRQKPWLVDAFTGPRR
jgi:hypothetical protein